MLCHACHSLLRKYPLLTHIACYAMASGISRPLFCHGLWHVTASVMSCPVAWPSICSVMPWSLACHGLCYAMTSCMSRPLLCYTRWGSGWNIGIGLGNSGVTTHARLSIRQSGVRLIHFFLRNFDISSIFLYQRYTFIIESFITSLCSPRPKV